MNTSAFLLLGSNLGDRSQNLAQARLALAAAGRVTAVSALYQTAAWGYTDQPDFYNQAVALETTLDAPTLLDTCLAIERVLGRERLEKWGARTMDIDIIFYGNAIINTSTLQIPHPRMASRRFVLIPLAEIAAGIVDPHSGLTVEKLLENCEDSLAVEKV